ncbi:MAG: F0F1 ATP synthase subunit B [Pirellulales bacterium]
MTALRCALMACVCLSVLMSSQRTALAAPAAGQAEADSHGHGEPSQIEKLAKTLGWRTDLAIWTAVVFLVTLAVLWKFAWGPIVAGLKKREDAIAQNIATAEGAAEEARKLTSEYEAKLAGAADEVRGIIEEARRDAEHTAQQIVEKAQQKTKEDGDRMLREVATAKDSALKEIADRGADLAVDLAAQIIRRELTASDHSRLIQQAKADFASTEPSSN